jgi:hypothetical protein
MARFSIPVIEESTVKRPFYEKEINDPGGSDNCNNEFYLMHYE